MLVLIASCTKQSEEDPDEIILVKIGDKTISDNEFIYRAEFTILLLIAREIHIFIKK